MTTETFNSWSTDAIVLLYALAFIFLTASISGKQAISWILMKLHEIFIQKNPIRI